MQISLDTSNVRYLIKRYTTTSITINDQDHTHSIIVSPHQLITPWRPLTLDELKPDDLQDILALSPSIVLLGVGAQQAFLPQEWLLPFYQRHIGVEIMTTPAACRTYNVLAGEGRSVVAALLLGTQAKPSHI